ncbi:Do family serine endopeptidase [Granulicella arctica]|uniref:Do family serine endopeptidase n=1 Tax=Granulicella arctica TaxID=940613 RepID=UPI0021E0E4FC|nr:Do family serine endopeptidase [Granulicella arctica]
MSRSTNELVVKMKRIAAPGAAVLATVLAATTIFSHTGVHAAGNVSSPLDDQSVSSLVALDNAVESVAARVSPAVVNVAVTSRGSSEHETADGQEQDQQQTLPPGIAQFFGGQMPRQQQPQQQQIEHGIGSGVIISPDGYIVTNNHVVDGAVQMRVTLNDRRIMTAKLIGVDKLTDLAVIKIDAKNLPSLSWGDSTLLHPGQTVLAFGSPFGYFQDSVTRGIVSAINRQNPYSDDARKPGGFIQVDAAINPGNSGGALVNAHGELVGIPNSIITNSGSFAGVGFAIPAQIARNVTEQLIKNGTVHHGYVGIAMNDVTPANASFFHLEEAKGAIVAQVTPDSPASRAGLQQGDVISKLNGTTVVNDSALQVAVSQIAPGTTISLGILRNGTPQTVSLKVGEYQANKDVATNEDGSSAQGGKLGLAVADLTPDIRQQLGVPSEVHGAAIERVRPASPAEDAALAPGDVILEVNRQKVGSAEQFVSAIHANASGKDLLLTVWSKGNASFRVVHPDQAG